MEVIEGGGCLEIGERIMWMQVVVRSQAEIRGCTVRNLESIRV